MSQLLEQVVRETERAILTEFRSGKIVSMQGTQIQIDPEIATDYTSISKLGEIAWKASADARELLSNLIHIDSDIYEARAYIGLLSRYFVTRAKMEDEKTNIDEKANKKCTDFSEDNINKFYAKLLVIGKELESQKNSEYKRIFIARLNQAEVTIDYKMIDFVDAYLDNMRDYIQNIMGRDILDHSTYPDGRLDFNLLERITKHVHKFVKKQMTNLPKSVTDNIFDFAYDCYIDTFLPEITALQEADNRNLSFTPSKNYQKPKKRGSVSGLTQEQAQAELIKIDFAKKYLPKQT